MSVPPGEHEYPDLKCPNCKQIYKLTQLDVEATSPPSYYCPNCDALVYQPDDE